MPAILALSAVHMRLVEAGLRTRCSLLVESDEPRDTHAIACLRRDASEIADKSFAPDKA